MAACDSEVVLLEMLETLYTAHVHTCIVYTKKRQT